MFSLTFQNTKRKWCPPHFFMSPRWEPWSPKYLSAIFALVYLIMLRPLHFPNIYLFEKSQVSGFYMIATYFMKELKE